MKRSGRKKDLIQGIGYKCVERVGETKGEKCVSNDQEVTTVPRAAGGK